MGPSRAAAAKPGRRRFVVGNGSLNGPAPRLTSATHRCHRWQRQAEPADEGVQVGAPWSAGAFAPADAPAASSPAIGHGRRRSRTGTGLALGNRDEVQAGQVFHVVGMSEVADDVPDREALGRSQTQGLIWVVEDQGRKSAGNRPAGLRAGSL